MRDGPERARMVRWYDPRMLLRAALDTTISGIFGKYADQRLFQAVSAGTGVIVDYSQNSVVEIPLPPSTPQYGADPQLPIEKADASAADDETRKEIWIDYVADLGDGWDSTYSIANLLARQQLSLRDSEPAEATLQRGNILIFGGDQVYPVASRQEYQRRLVAPYQAAFAGGADFPDLYAIPGNHDWYDGLLSFSNLFCARQRFAAPPRDAKRSQGCLTRQRRSYFALKLPYGWWLLATDVQLGSDIDAQQLLFFKAVAKNIQESDRIILCTPEPHWLKPKKEQKRDTSEITALEVLERDVLRHRILVFIAGDVHHYSRYQSDDTHLITAGGGGAFLHPTHGPWPNRVTQDCKSRPHQHPQPQVFERKATFPSRSRSWVLGLRNLYFPILNPSFGLLTATLYLIFGLLMIPAAARYHTARTNERLGPVTQSLAAAPTFHDVETDMRERPATRRSPSTLPLPATRPFTRRSGSNSRGDEVNRSIKQRLASTATNQPFDALARSLEYVQQSRVEVMSGQMKDITPADADTAAEVAALHSVEEELAATMSSVRGQSAARPENFFKSLIGLIRHEVCEVPDPTSALVFWIFGVIGILSFVLFTDIPQLWLRWLFGFLHSFAHFMTIYFIIWGTTYYLWAIFPANVATSNTGAGGYIWFYLCALVLGGIILGSMIMGFYLLISLNLFGIHWNEAFSSLRVTGWKCFLRLRIDQNGALTIYPIGVDRVCQKWKTVQLNESLWTVKPEQTINAHLIEQPIRVERQDDWVNQW